MNHRRENEKATHHRHFIDGIVNQVGQQWPLIENRFGKSIAKE
jgi:hypothetical protein